MTFFITCKTLIPRKKIGTVCKWCSFVCYRKKNSQKKKHESLFLNSCPVSVEKFLFLSCVHIIGLLALQKQKEKKQVISFGLPEIFKLCISLIVIFACKNLYNSFLGMYIEIIMDEGQLGFICVKSKT